MNNNSLKIPSGWHLLTLEQISKHITKGATPTTYGFDWSDEISGIPFLRSECVTSNGFNYKGMSYIPLEAHNAMERSKIFPGDILMTITGNIGRVASLPESIPEANINQHISRISICDEHHSEYVLQALQLEFYSRYYERILTGQAYPQISLKQVRETPILLPPYEEQKSIAKILLCVDKKISAISDKIAATQDLKKCLMQQLFSSVGMKLIKLGELLKEKPAYGANASACEHVFGSVRYVRITDINDRGRLLDSKVSLSLPDYKDYLLHDGDIIIARSGNTVGKSYLYNVNDGHCAYAGYLIRFRTDINKLLPRYLSQFLMTEFYWNWIKNNIKVGAQPNINAQQYQSLEIPICPLSVQENIINILETIDSKIDLLEQQKSETQLLKKGLMQKLLTGEWRVPLDCDAAAAA
ncbi:restriction endonuclease subunit S [Mixta calida]|uniref:restriction endonuclease subunit S n=1 Tax=Mixta calida TaxID=665913 RepID=UPI0034D48418